MAQMAALTTGQLDTLRTGQFQGRQYVLVWENEIIFQAQINQATFASGFASITYDNVTVGAYTDIKADFVVFVGAVAGKAGLKSASNIFRVRPDESGDVATSTVLNINETSAALTDDLYIMVVKDVRAETKLPRTIRGTTPAANTYPRDYAISTYRPLKPIGYGLQSAYILELNADGYADLPLPFEALATDADASSVSTYAWDSDGLAYQVGSSSSQQPTLRATSPGQYMPRVVFTDDQGNDNYFTFRVWVVPADLSSIVRLPFDAARITRDTVNGDTCVIDANITDLRDNRLRIDDIVDYSFVAIWWKTTQPIITSDIVFTGRFSSEAVGNNNVSLQDRMGIPLFNTNFAVDGIATQMGDVISRRLPILEATTPAVFGEIKTLTPWRALVYFLTEHSTIMNIHAFKFSDVTNDYQWPRFSTGDSSAFASAIDIMFTINASLNYLPTGEINVDRQAWYLNDTDRAALPVIASYTMQDMATGTGGGLMYSYSRRYIPQVGREMAGGAFYNSTTKDEQIMQAITPAVVQSRGTALTTFNRQVLKTNSTIAEAADELGQRTTDDVESRQPQTVLRVTHPSAYWWKSPSDAAWFKWTIPASTNNKGIESDTTVRWTLRSMSLDFDFVNGVPLVQAEYKLETQGGNWQTLVSTPIASGVVFYDPVVPIAPVYENFPEEPGNALSDSTDLGAEDNQPPFSEEDENIVNKPEDPGTGTTGGGQSSNGRIAVVWDDDNAWATDDIMGAPSYMDVTPLGSVSGTIRDIRFVPGANTPAAWLLTSDESNSSVWRNKSILNSTWLETETTIAGEYTQIRGTPGGPDAEPVNIYSPALVGNKWTHTFDFSTESGSDPDTTYGQGGWVNVNNNYGTYVAETGWEDTDGSTAIRDQRGVQIGLSGFTSTTITRVQAIFDWDRGVFSPADVVGYLTYGDGTLPIVKTGIGLIFGTPQTLTHEYNDSGITDVRVEVISDNVPDTPPQTRTGDVVLRKIVLSGTGSNPFTGQVDKVFIRRSSNGGRTFGNALEGGDSTNNAPAGGFDAYVFNDTVFLASDAEIQETTGGGSFTDVTGGSTPSPVFAECIRLHGRSTKNFIYNTSIPLSGETLWEVIGGVKAAITPNDGVADGRPVSANCLEASGHYPNNYFALLDFNGTTKFCFTNDRGSTWYFNTDITNEALHLALITSNGKFFIYIAGGTHVWVGIWDGKATTMTFEDKGSPSSTLKGIEVR
jgi:hypothetical protein